MHLFKYDTMHGQKIGNHRLNYNPTTPPKKITPQVHQDHGCRAHVQIALGRDEERQWQWQQASSF